MTYDDTVLASSSAGDAKRHGVVCAEYVEAGSRRVSWNAPLSVGHPQRPIGVVGLTVSVTV